VAEYDAAEAVASRPREGVGLYGVFAAYPAGDVRARLALDDAVRAAFLLERGDRDVLVVTVTEDAAASGHVYELQYFFLHDALVVDAVR
jgi:hypothetical protein